MNWMEVGTLLGFMLVGFLYFAQKLDGIRKDMHEEARDFHGRMCRLEEKYLKSKSE